MADPTGSKKKKFRTLKADVQAGLIDEAAGRVCDWDFADFLRRAHHWSVRRHGLEHLRIEDEPALGGLADHVARAQAPDEISEQRTVEELG